MDDYDYSSSAAAKWFSQFEEPFVSGLFDLSHNFSEGIDLRTRICTAEKFVRKAIFDKRLTEEAGLLVIGGGVAGACAAETARNLGIPVTIKEANKYLFSPQANSRTRWLHPYQYEWPSPIYLQREFPSDGKATPFRWSAGFANDIAQQWSDQFLKSITDDPLVTIQYEQTLKFYGSTIFELATNIVKTLNPVSEFGLMLGCTGFIEICDFDEFKGFKYWTTDPLGTPEYGLAAADQTILISGGGDGAMQDLLRLAWNEPPIEIIQAFEKALSLSEEGRNWWDASLLTIADEHYRLGAQATAAFYQTLLNTSTNVWDLIAHTVQETLRKEFHPKRVHLSFGQKYLPRGYALNRFLVELLRKYCNTKYSIDLFLPESRLQNISLYDDHQCGASPQHCYGVKHGVEFAKSTLLTQNYYDAIILRHGFDKRSIFGLSS